MAGIFFFIVHSPGRFAGALRHKNIMLYQRPFALDAGVIQQASFTVDEQLYGCRS